ncbi:MAG: hypothetical protein JWN80_1442 [Microbacteriaceae bacterium]|nr:hypothetical protein [Microbacteriaceae bacterium]
MSAPERDTAEWYSTFAENEARGQSAIYTEWALGVAGDPGIRSLIEGMPLQKRQPNLVFGVSRLLGAPVGPWPGYREWLLTHLPEVAVEAEHRMTQTNEARRCAVLLPALGLLAEPLALLEVGASAGLCLYPDRFSYSYDGVRLDPADGPSGVLLECETTGQVPVPDRMPEVAWRAGVDLHPLSVSDPDDMHWLETLVWPEQQERRDRLRAAIEIARQDPLAIEVGDAVDALRGLAAQAPSGVRLVIITSGVLVYLPRARRERFAEVVRSLDADWVSLEGRGALPAVEAALPEAPDRFVLSLNERPLAFAGPHGQSLDWF